MTALKSRQIRAMRIAISAGVAATLVLPVGVTMAWNQLLDSRASTSVAGATITIPDTPAALIAALGQGGQLSQLFVATLAADGVGGTVVLVPIGAATEVATVANVNKQEVSRRLADVYAADGLSGLANEVQGLLDVSFVAVGALARVELINLFAPLGGVDVLLDREVTTVAVDGTPTKLAEAGETLFPVDRVVDILLARGSDEKESQRFARHREVWSGIAERVGAGVELSPDVDTSPAGLADVTNFVRRVMAGTLQVWQLSAAPVLDSTLNPKRLDLYSLDRAEVIMVFASIAPSALAGGDYPLTVMVDSPFNDPIVSRAAVATLLEAGIGVGVMREVSAREASDTVVAAESDTADAIAALLSRDLGTITVESWNQTISGIDAAITLGGEFAELARSGG